MRNVAATELPNPDLNVTLTTIAGESRTLREVLTVFHMAAVVIDPYTNESSWILDTAARIMHQFRGAGVRVSWIVTCGPDDAKTFLGPLADDFLTYVDPDRSVVKALGLSELPAFVLVRGDGTIPCAAQGWSGESWRTVASTIAELVNWSKPTIPATGDPGAFRGTPALA